MATTTDHSLFNKGRQSSQSNKRHIYTTALVILLLTSSGINLLLTRQISDMRAAIRMLKQEIAAAEPLQNGKLFPSIQAQDANGEPLALNLLGYNQPTILYIFSPQCDWCTRNLDNIKALAEGTSEKYKLMGLSTSINGLKDYVVEHGLGFPVYAMQPSDRSRLRTGTPRTLIMSTDGKIIENWFGAYGGELQNKVEEYFQITLPGVTGDKGVATDGANRACE